MKNRFIIRIPNEKKNCWNLGQHLNQNRICWRGKVLFRLAIQKEFFIRYYWNLDKLLLCSASVTIWFVCMTHWTKKKNNNFSLTRNLICHFAGWQCLLALMLQMQHNKWSWQCNRKFHIWFIFSRSISFRLIILIYRMFSFYQEVLTSSRYWEIPWRIYQSKIGIILLEFSWRVV